MTEELNAFWHYYGGKNAAAYHYPKPKYNTIIEPFAGAAGYATLHHNKNVILVDKYHVIAEIWKYLIKATPAEIDKIPAGDNLKPFEHISELGDDCPEAMRWLVGFYMNKATVTPGLSLTAGQKRQRDDGKKVGWNVSAREKIARQVPFIKHWQCIEGDYWEAPDIEATWYIDPPYQGAGIHYKHNCKTIDFDKLGEWCRTRKGQVIVCENEGAKWMDFKPFRPIRASNMTSGYDKQNDGLSIEVIWTNDGEYQFDTNQRGVYKHLKSKHTVQSE